MDNSFGTQTISLAEWYESIVGKVTHLPPQWDNDSNDSDSGFRISSTVSGTELNSFDGESEYGDDIQSTFGSDSDSHLSGPELLPPDSSDDGDSDFGTISSDDQDHLTIPSSFPIHEHLHLSVPFSSHDCTL